GGLSSYPKHGGKGEEKNLRQSVPGFPSVRFAFPAFCGPAIPRGPGSPGGARMSVRSVALAVVLLAALVAVAPTAAQQQSLYRDGFAGRAPSFVRGDAN